MTPDEQRQKVIDDAVTSLGEHFDAVQVMVSWGDCSRTKCKKSGSGNWYARQGMAHEFINENIAEDNAAQIASKLTRNPDGGEEWKT